MKVIKTKGDPNPARYSLRGALGKKSSVTSPNTKHNFRRGDLLLCSSPILTVSFVFNLSFLFSI